MLVALPPGPRLAPLQTLLFVLDPYGYLAACQKRYGDPFFVPALVGPTAVTGDPEAVRTLLSAPPEMFSSAAEFVSPLVGKNSLVVTRPERHKAQRKLLMPPLSASRMRAYGRLMMDISSDVVSRWQAGRPFRMLDEQQRISFLIIMHGIFGVTEPDRVAQLRSAILEKVAAFKVYLMMFKALRRELGGFGPWARFQRAARYVDELLDEEISRRRREGRYGEDVFSLLLSAKYDDGSAFTDEELRHNLITLLIGGYETTAKTLSWALYWLHRHPDKLERARAEVDALGPEPDPDLADRLPYLTAVCNESLRLNPVILQFSRILLRDLDFKGYRLPAGTMVSAGISLVHAVEELYAEPHTFEPERFLRRSYAPHEFLPFGGGSRRCVGAAFATYEMKQVLAIILKSCRLKLVSDRPERAVLRGPTMGPERGVEMELVERRSNGQRQPAPMVEP